MGYFINILKGIVIGIANAIPGVSGGTMAVIMKIYDRLIDAVSLSFEKLKKNWKFLLTLGIGMIVGILLAAQVLSFLFKTYNVPTQFFFIGLIAGSLPMIWNEATSEKKFSPMNIIPFLIGVGLILTVSLVSGIENKVYTEMSLPLAIYMIVAMAISAMAMIIPGISGSMVMTVLGGYQTVLSAINDFNIPILIVMAIGGAIGILGGAKLISVLLKKWKQPVYFVIIGLIIGSFYSIYPKEFAFNSQGIIAILVFLIGITIPSLMELPNKRKVK